ncbi:AraC family transcriptional regulator [Clostridium sp. YIM B02515]|uniref:AraC family transcriptional regulator n=2 Tax=Clostridium rhizosphaerae TaxID=2803861 RepID=A0ABS1T5L3_9CLOT|nr:AraC family transcriptional regulator [Clostridium rhizosphaerae]
MKILESSNTRYLSQISYSSTYMDNMANSFCKSVYLNNYTKAFMNSDAEDLISLGNTSRTLDALTVPNLYIHSLYIYNRKLDTFISTDTGAFYKSSDFYDQEIVNMIKNDKQNKTSELVPFPRKCPTPAAYHEKSTDFTNTYTYKMQDNDASSDETRGAIILNINSDWLRNTMLSLNDGFTSKDCELFVINEDGLVINHSKSEDFMKNISNEDYIKHILSSKTPSGSFIQTINRKKYIFSYVSSSSLKWKFISMTPYSSVFSSIDKLKLVTVLFCIMVLILGLLFSIIASKRLYFPINALTNNIKKNFINLSASENNMDELNFISNTFIKIFDKANKLESLQNNNIESLKNDYLKKLLIGNESLSKSDTSNKIDELGISLDFENDILISILKLDHYKKFMEEFDEKDRSLYKYGTLNIAYEMISKRYTCEVVDMGTDHFAIIININESGEMTESIYDNLKTLVLEIQEYVIKYLHLSLSATLGYISHEKNTITYVYNNTLNISMYRLKYGHASIITPAVLKDILTDNFKFPSSKEKIILDSLKLGNIERAKEAYYDIISTISNYSYDNIMASIIYLIFSIYNTTNNLIENNHGSFSNVFTKFFSEVSSYETLDEINQTFINIFSEITNAEDTIKCNKSNIIAKNIIDVINENYHDKNLCLNSISERLNMSSVYIGRLFKEITRKSVSEYILNVRMEKVKYFLDNTNLPINEILERVGLERSNYFYTTFKKYFGVSLTNYKLETSQKKSK